MTLKFPDGSGLRFPDWPSPWDAAGGVLGARGWSLADKFSLMKAFVNWKMTGFTCDSALRVAELCQGLSSRIKMELIDPLCVSALNTPSEQASASVFLKVLNDCLFGVSGGSRLLLPRVDLNALFPMAAAQWLQQNRGQIKLGQRVETMHFHHPQWQVKGHTFDAVILASSASNAALMLMQSAQEATNTIATNLRNWSSVAQALRFEPIATVYAWAPTATLPQAMLTLRSDPSCPAQFAFDRGKLGGPAGLLAFVVSAAQGDRMTLQQRVLAQARTQLGLELAAIQTVVEKRATFACIPGLQRPTADIAEGLWACGDYVAGPYPATLEGAVRSATQATAFLYDAGLASVT
jgi:hypothetical protein